jgi:hypothetical protein
MVEPFPLGSSGERRSDRHGVIERDPTLALSGPLLDPGDIAAYGLSRNTVRNSCARTASSRSSTFQTARASWTLRRQVVADAAAGSGEVAQAEAHSQAITRRSGRPRLQPVVSVSWGWSAIPYSRPSSANPASGWEKGHIEKNVQDSRHRLRQPMPDFPPWRR